MSLPTLLKLRSRLPWGFCHSWCIHCQCASARWRKTAGNLKETRTLKRALELAINIEMGNQNQLKFFGTPAHAVSNQLANTSINKSWNNPRTTTNNFRPAICPNCGYSWSPNRRPKCPARGKICKNCGITYQFAKICPKPKKLIKPKHRVNNVNDASSEAATVGTSATVEEVNQIDSMLQKHNIYDVSSYSDYDDLDDNCVAVSTNDNSLREVETVNLLQVQFGNIKTKH